MCWGRFPGVPESYRPPENPPVRETAPKWRTRAT
ncbi:BnaC07g48840D [Brassica napus]|uniref:BnaC07g48840D protein n=1 Tax=Brassica napus TaxID=3708 RepID=A0A078J2Z2_BRANA|nr:BnaC07g48840D [Brassica napus]